MANINVVDNLLDILSKRIKMFERGLRKQMAADTNKDTISKLVETLKNDPYALATINKKELLGLFSKYLVSTHVVELEELTRFFNERYDVTAAVARGYTQGVMIKYDPEDIKTVNRVIEYLQECLKAIENYKTAGIKRMDDEKNSYSVYYRLYDKLRSKEEMGFYTEEEINLMEDLIEDEDYDYYVSVMKYIYDYNRRVYNARLIQSEDELKDLVGESAPKKKHVSIDEEVLKQIFDNYGFTLDGMPEEIYKAILNTCDAGRIIDIFDYVSATPEYSFLRDFGRKSLVIRNEKDKKVEVPKNKALIRKQFIVLYQILRYSNKSILKYLAEDCEEKNVSLEEVILKVKGVVRHVGQKREKTGEGPERTIDDLTCIGTFENYKANSDELLKLGQEHNGADYLQYALNCERYTNVLGTDSERFKKNIMLLKLYGYPFNLMGNKYSVERMPWMMALAMDSKVLVSRLDLLIENGIRNGNRDESFRYFLKYPSVVYYDPKFIEGIICKSYNGSLRYTYNGKLESLRKELYDVEENFYRTQIKNENLDILRAEIPDKYRAIADSAVETDLDYSDEYLDRLNDAIIGEGSYVKGLAYDWKGVMISLPKVKRIWKAIRENYENDFDLDKLFMYALTYGSYYMDSEIELLNSVINGRKFG